MPSLSEESVGWRERTSEWSDKFVSFFSTLVGIVVFAFFEGLTLEAVYFKILEACFLLFTVWFCFISCFLLVVPIAFLWGGSFEVTGFDWLD